MSCTDSESSNEKNISNKCINIQNVKSVMRMNDYLKRMYYSYNSICEVLTDFIEQLYEIYNEVNFQCVNVEIIERYNKSIYFLYETLNGILSDTISSNECNEIHLIKPVEHDKYFHNLTINYFIDDCTSITRHLGCVSNACVDFINDQVVLRRGELCHVFAKIPLDSDISVEDFRYHLDVYLYNAKQFRGLFFKDVEYTKDAIKRLINIIEESVKIKQNKKYIKHWKCAIIEIHKSIKLIKTCNKVNNSC